MSLLLPINKHKDIFILCFLWMLWSYNYVAMKEALLFSNPATFSVLRTFIAVFTLAIFFRKKLSFPQKILPYFIIGVLNTSFFVFFTTMSLQNNSAGRSAILSFTMPFWALILSRIFLKEIITPQQGLAFVLCFAGVGILCKFSYNWQADTFAILSGVSLAASTIYAKHLLNAKIITNIYNLLFWQMLCGGIILTFFLMFEGWQLSLTPNFICALLFSSIPANAFGWIIWFYLLQRVSAGLAGMNILVVPLLTILLTRTETISLSSFPDLVGIILISLGLMTVCILNLSILKRDRI